MSQRLDEVPVNAAERALRGRPRVVAVVPCYRVADRIGEVVLALNAMHVEEERAGASHVRHDCSNGMALVDAIVDLARLAPGYFFEPSLLCEAYLAGAVVRDVPTTARYEGETSSLSIRRVGGYHWWQNAGSGIATPTGTIMLSVLPVIVGIQLLVQAVVMDVANVPAESPWRGGRS